MNIHTDQIHEVRYPTLPINNINSSNFSVKWSSNIGEVLRIDTISSNDVCNIIHLFGELIRFDESFRTQI